MTYVVLGVILALIELYAWLLEPRATASPLLFSAGIPAVVAVAALKRPRAERPSVLALAASLAVSLNRDLFVSRTVAHLLVLVGATITAWSGFAVRKAPSSPPPLAVKVSATVVIAAFVTLWLLRFL